MKKFMFLLLLGVMLIIAAPAVQAASDGNIEFYPVREGTLAPESYALAGDLGGFYTADYIPQSARDSQEEALFFGYHYTDPWDYWGGYGVSNRTVVAGDDSLHQFTVWGGADHTPNDNNNYAFAYDDWETGIGAMYELLDGPEGLGHHLEGAWYNNMTWTYEYMEEYYDADDWYHLIVTGYDSFFNPVGSDIVDLTGVGDWIYAEFDWDDVSFVGTQMLSSDSWTPNYFCMDDVNAVPIPGAVWLLGSGLLALLGVRRKRS